MKKMIINMPTGSGKTRTVVEGLVDYWRVLANQKSYVVWMAHSEELCEQAVETIKNIWSLRGEKNLNLYRLWSDYNPEFVDAGGFIVTSFGKIYSMMKSQNDQIFDDSNLMFGHPAEAYGLIGDAYVDTSQKKGFIFLTNGAEKMFTQDDNSGFYKVEAAFFKLIKAYF